MIADSRNPATLCDTARTMTDADGTVMRAGPGDVRSLVDLVNGAYRGDSSREGWTTEADFLGGQRTDEESMRALLEGPDSVVLVMRDDSGVGESRLNACVHLKRQPHGVVYLGMLTVRPRLQNSGVGRQLLAAAEGYAQQALSARVIEMTVINVRDALIAWYERRGYVRTGEERPFPYGDARFGLPLREDLKFVVLQRDLKFWRHSR